MVGSSEKNWCTAITKKFTAASGVIRHELSLEQTSAKSEFKFNRDLCLLVCTDLSPFSTESGVGYLRFFAKDFPDVHLPY